MSGSSRHAAALVSPRCGGSQFALSLGGGREERGENGFFVV